MSHSQGSKRAFFALVTTDKLSDRGARWIRSPREVNRKVGDYAIRFGNGHLADVNYRQKFDWLSCRAVRDANIGWISSIIQVGWLGCKLVDIDHLGSSTGAHHGQVIPRHLKSYKRGRELSRDGGTFCKLCELICS
jgi:hypothetical protein